jgi:hypothetical protein
VEYNSRAVGERYHDVIGAFRKRGAALLEVQVRFCRYVVRVSKSAVRVSTSAVRVSTSAVRVSPSAVRVRWSPSKPSLSSSFAPRSEVRFCRYRFPLPVT